MNTHLDELRELNHQIQDCWFRLQTAIERYKKDEQLGYLVPMSIYPTGLYYTETMGKLILEHDEQKN